MDETKTQHDIAVLQKLGEIDKNLALNTLATSNQQTLMEKIDATVQKLDDKVGVQNGRVRTLEDFSANAKKILESVTESSLDYKINKTRLWTALAVFFFLGATIVTLTIMVFKNMIKDATLTNDNKIDLRVDAYIKDNYSQLK